MDKRTYMMRKGSKYEAEPPEQNAGSIFLIGGFRAECDRHRPESNGIGDDKANQCHQAEAFGRVICTNRRAKAGPGMWRWHIDVILRNTAHTGFYGKYYVTSRENRP